MIKKKKEEKKKCIQGLKENIKFVIGHCIKQLSSVIVE